jgi:hypothetical protein
MHYIIQVNPKSKRLAKYATLKAEIQIRSILQHTWAEIEHDLGYKNNFGVPREVKRNFFRLAGILELADKEFKEIRDNIKDYTARVSRQMKTETGEILIDDNSIELYILYNNTVNKLNHAILQINNNSFKEDALYAVSIVKELNWLGFRNIKEINEALEEDYGLTLYIAQRILSGRGSRSPVDKSVGLFYLCYATLVKEREPGKIVKFWTDNKIVNTSRPAKENLRQAQKLISIYDDFLAKEKAEPVAL